MRITTFYSFCSGTGKSTALINCAHLMAAKGHRVLAVDLSLESPRISNTHQGSPEKDALDLVCWAFRHAQRYGKDSYRADIVFDEGPPIAAFVTPGPPDTIIINTARYYFERLAASDLGSKEREALILVGRVLKSYFALYEDRYSHILINARSGISESVGIAVGPLCGQYVVFTTLSDQAIMNTYLILCYMHILRPGSAADDPAPGPKPLLVVASPVPYGDSNPAQEKRLEILRTTLGLRAVARLTYCPHLALGESDLVHDFPEAPLTEDYKKLTDWLVSKKENTDVR